MAGKVGPPGGPEKHLDRIPGRSMGEEPGEHRAAKRFGWMPADAEPFGDVVGVHQRLVHAERREAARVGRAPVPGSYGWLGCGQRDAQQPSSSGDDAEQIAGGRVVACHQIERKVGGVGQSGELPGVREEIMRDMGGRLPAAPVERAGRAPPVRGLVWCENPHHLGHGSVDVTAVHRAHDDELASSLYHRGRTRR